MKKLLYIIAIIGFFIGATCFFSANNNVAGAFNAFAGICFVIAYQKNFKRNH